MKRPVSLFCSLTCHCFSHEDLLEKVSEHDLIHIIFNIFQQLWFLVINQRKHLWIEIWFLLFTEPSSKAKPRGKELSHILCAAGRARTWRERWVMEPLQRHFLLQPICEREDWKRLRNIGSESEKENQESILEHVSHRYFWNIQEQTLSWQSGGQVKCVFINLEVITHRWVLKPCHEQHHPGRECEWKKKMART